MTRDERRIARKCYADFVGLGELYARSGLPEKRFWPALKALLSRNVIIDGYGTIGRYGYSYKVRRAS